MGEGGRVAIPPGDTLKLFERLGISGVGTNDAMTAAAALSGSYVSDRSVALLIREAPGKLQVGSGVSIRIDNRYLIGTVKHNLQDADGKDLPISNIEVRSRGEKWGRPLKVARAGLSSVDDLAWLEIDPESLPRRHLHFVADDDFGCFGNQDDLQPCFLQGYPAASVDAPAEADGRPLLESDPLLTLSIAPARRKGPAEPGTFAVEWPPHDRSLDDSLPEPYGVSGGGVWLVSKFEDGIVWSPARSKLIGIARSWRKDNKEEVVVGIERWLELIAVQFPELRGAATAILARSSL
jgi:hypothetical protein